MSMHEQHDKPLVLVIDQGGHATRIIVFDGRGRRACHAEAAIATQRPAQGRVEHDPDELVRSVAHCLQSISRQMNRDDLAGIVAAALCTQRSSIVGWSRTTGRALTPVISWQDVRAADMLKDFPLSDDDVHAITGLHLSPHYGASKMRWVLENVPAAREAYANGDLIIGPLAAYLVFQLTGKQAAIDPCNASRTLLWDMRQHEWSSALLEAFSIPRECLPECRPNRSDWGTVRLNDADIPLAIVTGDQSAVPFAFDTDQADQAFLTLGTGAFLQYPENRATRCGGLLNSVLLQDETRLRYALEATINGAGSAIRWLAETEQAEESRLIESLPEWLEREVEPPLFLNAVGGLAAPYWQATAQSRFVGQTDDVPAKAVAIIESIVFLVRVNLDRMHACGRNPEQLIAVGGLAVLDGLLQRLATLCEIPVARAAELEATAYGGARLALGSLPPESVERRFMPEPGLSVDLKMRYRAWWGQMAELVKTTNQA